MVGRSNVIVGKTDKVTAGGGLPGGTNGILYIDTTLTVPSLKLIMPDGAELHAEWNADAKLIQFVGA